MSVPRPRVLPQDRWLVSAADLIHHRVYKRNGWLRGLLTRKRWRCVSGSTVFLNAYDAWDWVQQHCVNRVVDDWHGVGYARWMMAQSLPQDELRKPLNHLDPWLSYYTTQPKWVYEYRNGPPTTWA